MEVSVKHISKEEAEMLRKEEIEYEQKITETQISINEAYDKTYFELCKKEKKENPVMYAFRDRVLGVIYGAYPEPPVERIDYFTYSNIKIESEKISLEKKFNLDYNKCMQHEARERILDTYNYDKSIDNMIYFEFVLYLEEQKKPFYKGVEDKDYSAVKRLDDTKMPCLHTWKKHQFDTRKNGVPYKNEDNLKHERYICASHNWLPIIDKCFQYGKLGMRELFLSSKSNKRTYNNYQSLYQLFMTPKECSWRDIYILESFSGFLLSNNIYCYFSEYLKEIGASTSFNEMLKTYVEELAKIENPFLRLYAFEMTKVPHTSNKELELKFGEDKDTITNVIQKINQVYTNKWELSKKRIRQHLYDYWDESEIKNVLINACNTLENNLFFIDGTSNKFYSAYYNDISIKEDYKDKWYLLISNMVYEKINA